MIHFLKIEWLKLYKYKAFLMLFLLFVVSVFGFNYMVREVLSFDDKMISMLVGRPFQFPLVWNTVAFLSSILLFIPGLIIILIMSNEYSFRTHRQNIIDGMSRTQFILTKEALIVLFSLFLTLLVFLVACFFGLIETNSSFTLAGIKYIPYFFIQSMSYLGIALVMVLLLKRSGIAIGVYFLYVFILENVLGALINKYIWNHGSELLPLDSADALIPVPLFFNVTQSRLDEPVLLAVSCAWILACFWFCKWKFEKSDL